MQKAVVLKACLAGLKRVVGKTDDQDLYDGMIEWVFLWKATGYKNMGSVPNLWLFRAIEGGLRL